MTPVCPLFLVCSCDCVYTSDVMQMFRWVICVCVIGGEPSWPHDRNVRLLQSAVACCHTGVCASPLGPVVLVHAPQGIFSP